MGEVRFHLVVDVDQSAERDADPTALAEELGAFLSGEVDQIPWLTCVWSVSVVS